MSESTETTHHFIDRIIAEDLANGKHQHIVTRFPPEPNGYLHIGHAKSICLNFGMAEKYQGKTNLRFDDTNPEKEESRYALAIEEDIRWLGFDWAEKTHHASDYFQQLYDYAVQLIDAGKAYVCALNNEEMRAYRGTLQSPGQDSPYRNRSIEENRQLFAKMKAGVYQEGEYVLRAKIDMAAGNINLRDPIIYRIRHSVHQRTGDSWCIYPMYDFTHCLSDAIEGITHSLCTLEFQDHRPLYEWFLSTLETPARPQQIEFARLNLSHTLSSKRKLKQLVDENYVTGWDDPRMSTLVGMRNRGYPAGAIRKFCEQVGISKSDSVIAMSLLEECVRDELNQSAHRAMAVLKPLKVVLTNYTEKTEEILQANNHPNDENLGQRAIPFSQVLYIEQDDFMEQPVAKFHRLAPGKEVRLRGAYVIRCDEVIKNESGEITELRCHYDQNTLGKKPEGRKVKGVIHWVSAAHAISATVRLYDRLFKHENPAAQENFLAEINPHSITVLENCLLEPSLGDAILKQTFQFERLGYFNLTEVISHNQTPVFHRVVSLRDSWK